jgi:hypothetical protein
MLAYNIYGMLMIFLPLWFSAANPVPLCKISSVQGTSTPLRRAGLHFFCIGVFFLPSNSILFFSVSIFKDLH